MPIYGVQNDSFFLTSRVKTADSFASQGSEASIVQQDCVGSSSYILS